MRRIIWLFGLVTVAVSAQAQTPFDLDKLVKDSRTPVRIPIRSADPWMVKMMLEGTPVTQPEYSTLLGGGLGGGANGGGGGGNQASGLGGGTAGGGGLQSGAGGSTNRGLLPDGWIVVVNPTDNSLWLYPKRRG